MTVLIDTDVLIDIRRGTPSAQMWLRSVEDEAFAVPGIVVLELLAGCRDQRGLQSTQAFLRGFVIVYPSEDEFAAAIDLFSRHHLASGLGMADSLIAAMTLARGACLLTVNRRHLGVVTGLDLLEPYTRT